MEVFGEQESECIPRKQYNAVIRACYADPHSTIEYDSDKCTEEGKTTAIPDYPKKGEFACMKPAFAKDICPNPN
jgi:hypothetical protein